MSSGRPEAVVDTVVLMYFLLVGEEDILIDRLGCPVAVPRIVFDPDEGPDVPEVSRSELARSVEYHARASRDLARHKGARAQSEVCVKRLQSIQQLYNSNRVVVLDMSEPEMECFSALTSPTRCQDVGLLLPLGLGEAACVAIANSRGLILVTDDNQALMAFKQLNPDARYERIRRILRGAWEDGLISQDRANDVHGQMRQRGFWDRDCPVV